MDSLRPGFLRLPIELRHQIYEMCFAERAPEPGLLSASSAIHHDSMQFLGKCQQTFTLEISGQGTTFDGFSRWCFKIKRHTPKYNRMKHLIVNISPPDPHSDDNGGLEMWNVWISVRNFCIDLASHQRIPRLAVRFLESDKTRWARGTMRLRYTYPGSFYYDDVAQILIVLARYVDNVDKPTVILPDSYIRTFDLEGLAQQWATNIEKLMTGYWEDEDYIETYRELERRIRMIKWAN